MSVWQSVDRFATAWVRSPHTEAFRRGLAPKAADPDRPPLSPQSVAELLATYSPLHSQLLLLAKRLPHLPLFPQLYVEPGVREWFDVSRRFAFSLVETIEFLRSRLPGYPRLLVPDLVRGAPRVRSDGFWDARFPWELEIRQAGLQLQNQPTLIAQALEFADGGREAYAALSEVSRALQESQAWLRFRNAHASLGVTEISEGKTLRRKYSEAVSESRADTIAGDTGMRDAAFRRGELDRLKAGAGDVLEAYYLAFAEIDELIDTVAAFITHRVAKGSFDVLEPFEADWSAPSELRHVRFKAVDTEMIRHPYELIAARVPVHALAGVVLLRDLTCSWKPTGITLTAQGRLLSGSADLS